MKSFSIDRKILINSALSVALISVGVGCAKISRNKTAISPSGSVSAKASPDALTPSEASQITTRSSHDLPTAKKMRPELTISAAEEIPTDMITGLDLSSDKTKDSESDIRKKTYLSTQISNMITGEKRGTVMTLITASYFLSQQTKEKGGIMAQTPIERATYVYIRLLDMKTSNGNTLEGLNADDVDVSATRSPITELYASVKNLTDESSAQNRRLTELESKTGALSKLVDEYGKRLDATEAAIKALDKKVDAKTDEIVAQAARNKEISDMKIQINQQETTLAGKRNTRKSLVTIYDTAVQGKRDSRGGSASIAQKKVDAAKADLKAIDQSITDLETLIKSETARIRDLETTK